MDIEKAFDSLNHNFLISALGKYGFGKNFMSWVRTLLRNQELCVLIQSGTTTKYFLLRRGARQFNPISAHLFILALEILFHIIRSKPEMKRLAIFDSRYLYSAYADDTTFFLQDTISIKHKADAFYLFICFSCFSELKPNFKNSEIAGIAALKGLQLAVCGLHCIDLNNDTLKILSTNFSYNEKLKEEKKFETVTDFQRV